MKKRYQKKSNAVAPTVVTPKKINQRALAKSRVVQSEDYYQFAQYEPPPGVIPAEQKSTLMAMDSTPYQYLNESAMFACQYVQYHFPGYPVLAMWSQFPEYRKMSETIAKEMTRKWIRITCTADEDKTGRVQELEQALEDFCVKKRFEKCAELDGFFGRGQLYINLTTSGADENKKPLIRDPRKIGKGALVGFNVIEPVWTYPGAYNANDPIATDYYKPTKWYVMSQCIDASRLLMFISREVPDLLKSAYNFGGLSLSQLAKPYVDNWLRTRKSVGDMVHSYSLSGIKTDMATVLAGNDADSVMDRAEFFNNLRDNRGLMLLNAGEPNSGGEEFFQFNTPLSGLDKLQAQAQEQMASVSSIPLVKLLGITPSGLNATSDGEIRVFYDYIHSMQESIFTDNLKVVIEIIMLHLWGEIDKHISFEFEPLWSMDEIDKAQVRKSDAETDATLIGAGAISPMESRQRVASDPDSGYNSIEVDEDSEMIDSEEDITEGEK